MSPSLPAPATVLVADPDDVARLGLCTLLKGDPRFTVVGETATDVLALAAQFQPAVVVLDPAPTGALDLPLLLTLASATPHSHICVWTTALTPAAYLQMLHAGVHGCLWKGQTQPIALANALATLAGSDTRVLATLPATARAWLTTEEHAVLRLLTEGYREAEIAKARSMSLRSLQAMLCRLRTRLCARTPAVLGAQAILLELVVPGLTDLVT